MPTDVTRYIGHPHASVKNPLFIKWLTTTESAVWHCLAPRIIRAEMRNSLGQLVYENYFRDKRLLCCCWKQSAIAEMMGLKSTGRISEALKSMHDRGIITIHQDVYNSRMIKVYELGKLGPEPQNRQIWHLHNVLHREFNDLELKRLL